MLPHDEANYVRAAYLNETRLEVCALGLLWGSVRLIPMIAHTVPK